MPTCYAEGFRKALEIDPDIASNYITHTTIGDPEADALIEELSTLDRSLSTQYINAAMDRRDDELTGAPSIIRDFFVGAS